MMGEEAREERTKKNKFSQHHNTTILITCVCCDDSPGLFVGQQPKQWRKNKNVFEEGTLQLRTMEREDRHPIWLLIWIDCSL